MLFVSLYARRVRDTFSRLNPDTTRWVLTRKTFIRIGFQKPEKSLVSKIEDLRSVKSSTEEKEKKSNQRNREKCEYALCNRFTC